MFARLGKAQPPSRPAVESRSKVTATPKEPSSPKEVSKRESTPQPDSDWSLPAPLSVVALDEAVRQLLLKMLSARAGPESEARLLDSCEARQLREAARRLLGEDDVE